MVMRDEQLAARTRELFRRYGLELQVDVYQGAAATPDAVLFIRFADLVIAGPVAAFLAAIAAAAGKDAYRELKRIISELRGEYGQPAHVVVIRDHDRQAAVLLEDNLPDQALKELFELELEQFVGADPLTWDRQGQRWRARPFPQRRTDVVGWFRPAASVAKSWHLTRNAAERPLRTLCGTPMDDVATSDKGPWGADGGPCYQCLNAVSELPRPEDPHIHEGP